jgi:DNA-binding CsgD family transcriptional regulator
VLRASPESDALIILGRLLDSLPIGFHVTDCSDAFHVLYGNQAWEHWLGPDKLPVAGKALSEVFPTASSSGVLDLMREVCRTARPQHLKGFEFRELGILERGKAGETSRWDWEIYPLSGPGGEVTHLLNVVMDVSETSQKEGGPPSADERQEGNRRREEASGILRIFGLAPDSAGGPVSEALSPRERQVADLVALGQTNAEIGQQLNVSPTTVSSHVGHILSKLGFRSRAQVAVWVIESRLGAQPAQESSSDEAEPP